jgi:hypothetical protein
LEQKIAEWSVVVHFGHEAICYCVSTMGLDEETVREYIRNQEQNDRLQEEP